ncbi:MAG: LPS assembly lipoprotein LptE [Gammaproteobacteria bacterium]|jgi:LPS-assembly lipoprotein|nr:LPS assembly lipoprotein LptE [Gammaproteobacteria bacterium]
MMKRHTSTARRSFAAFVVAALLTGCGFHLRGAQDVRLQPELSPMLISGIGTADPLYAALAAALAEGGVTVTKQAGEANSFLLLSARENRRRVVSVNAKGQAIEYDVVEGVTFELRDRNRETLVEEQRIEVDRTYTDPAGDPLALAGERVLLREQARQDLVQQIVRRLRFGTR